MSDYRPIGRIIRLQIQTSSLKVDAEPRRYYTPDPIRQVEALEVRDGVIAADIAGCETVDIHSAAHPDSRNRDNGNMLSIGFTGHYKEMSSNLGAHLVCGIAGENILVDYTGRLHLADVESGLAIKGPDGRRIEFDTVSVAHPCVEFSRFCLDDRDADPKAVSRTLKFLDGGTRGFYAVVSSALPARIETGDLLLARF